MHQKQVSGRDAEQKGENSQQFHNKIKSSSASESLMEQPQYIAIISRNLYILKVLLRKLALFEEEIPTERYLCQFAMGFKKRNCNDSDLQFLLLESETIVLGLRLRSTLDSEGSLKCREKSFLVLFKVPECTPLWLEDQQAPVRPYRSMSRIIVSVATAW